MKKIDKGEAPAFFTDFVKKERPKVWDDIAPIRSRLRKCILENEQQGYCAYTEIKINNDNDCHIDHYRTRNLFPEKTFEYQNLLVSCNAEEYGAKYKDKHVKEKSDYDTLVNPVEDNPADYMEYAFTGEVLPIDDNEKGMKTIAYFNLNQRSLLNRRKKAILSLKAMKGMLNESELVEAIGEFETMLRQLYAVLD